MVVEQKHIDWIGIRVSQIHFAELLKCLRCDLTRIWRKTVRYFETVLICLMLLMPAVGVHHGIGHKRED